MFKNAEDSITRKNWDWRENPIKIRRGQIWKKLDSGNIVEVTKVCNDYLLIQQPCKRKAHHITKKDLLMFWKQL